MAGCVAGLPRLRGLVLDRVVRALERLPATLEVYNSNSQLGRVETRSCEAILAAARRIGRVRSRVPEKKTRPGRLLTQSDRGGVANPGANKSLCSEAFDRNEGINRKLRARTHTPRNYRRSIVNWLFILMNSMSSSIELAGAGKRCADARTAVTQFASTIAPG